MMKLPQIVIAQINTTPNAFESNFNKIVAGINEATKKCADLVVFPELSIPGYSVKDLVYETGFIEKNLDYLQKIVELSRKCCAKIVVGYIDRNYNGSGKPFRNMAAVIYDGRIEATYQKHLLPFYDVFDEGRYFEPGKDITVIDLCGMKWGIAICEDLWNDKGADDYLYSNNPLKQYEEIGIKNIISINASPFHYTKESTRIKTLFSSFRKHYENLIYVNLVGGQDDLVFDGHSMVISEGLIKHYSDLKETYDFVDINNTSNHYLWNYFIEGRDFSVPTIASILELSLKDYIFKNKFNSVVFGSSGGIDSALVATIASKVLYREAVHAIRMPSVFSSKGSIDDAKQLHDKLRINDYLVPIDHNSFVDDIDKKLRDSWNCDLTLSSPVQVTPNAIAYENIQARMRGITVMHFSNAFGALPLTTGNKSELSVGYCTLYGDTNGGFAPISDMWKSFVYQLANHYKDYIPESIINKRPSAELNTDQYDEKELLPYPVLDPLLFAYVEKKIVGFDSFEKWCNSEEFNLGIFNKNSRELVEKFFESNDARKQYEKIERLIIRAEFKRRQLAPGTKISPVAFGSGRRLPISRG